MGNELIPADVFGDVSPLADATVFEELGNSSKFLRRIDLKSKGVLIDTGKVKPGHYCVVKSSQEADDLGDSIDILPLTLRSKAIDMSDTNQIIVTYDRGSELFDDIEKRASVKDSRCQYGVSFLIIERSTAKMYELFLGSTSNRREVPTLLDFLPHTAADIKRRNKKGVEPHGPLPLTMKSKRVESKVNGWSWFVMVPKPCSNPFTKDQIPAQDAIKAEMERFMHPDDGNKPEVETKAGGAQRAR